MAMPEAAPGHHVNTSRILMHAGLQGGFIQAGLAATDLCRVREITQQARGLGWSGPENCPRNRVAPMGDLFFLVAATDEESGCPDADQAPNAWLGNGGVREHLSKDGGGGQGKNRNSEKSCTHFNLHLAGFNWTCELPRSIGG